MDIYDYINSKDVREFAEKIEYQFSAPEAAFLVYHSDGKPMEERMQAWQEIISTMADCPVEKRYWLDAADSFHAMLRNYMELQRRKMELFPGEDVLEMRPFQAYDKDKYTQDLDGMFDGMCFDFPTPFNRGDILTTHGDDAPFVFSYITTWDSKEMFKRGFHAHECPWSSGWEKFNESRANRLKRGDKTDMHVLGTITYQGNLFRDNIMVVPTDLEYFTDELTGYNRQLKPISMYEKGEIDHQLLVNSCFSIRMDEMAKKIREECVRSYRKVVMEEMGV